MKSGRYSGSDLGPTRYGPGTYDYFPQLADPDARADAPYRTCHASSCVRPQRDTRQECLDHDPNLSDREPSAASRVGQTVRTC